MAERTSEDSSFESSENKLPSEELAEVAATYQHEIAYQLEYDSLAELAEARCEQLNTMADRLLLMGERASVATDRVVLARSSPKIDGQRIDVHRPHDIDRLDTLTGYFKGYGWLITEHDGGYRGTIGAKIVTGYNRTLPFSEGADVAFCPVGVSQIEFEHEQKERRLNEVRAILLERLALYWYGDIVQTVGAIDELASGQAIENVRFLYELSFKVQVLLMQIEKMPNPDMVIDPLLDLLSVHLELPQQLNIHTSMYRSPIAGSSEWRVYRSNKDGPRYLPGVDSHLMIAQSMQRPEIFLAGTYMDKAVQIPLKDLVVVEPTLK